ncbi:MAG: DNA sulfur modification protein DndD, partial [Alphaproteobacteria bacterium]
MTLDELVLHDFGAYGGHQSVALTPVDPARPIVLFGGMNGGGKTTLLDAIQLCLYGTFAKTSNRGGLSYPSYLERSIHRAPGVTDAAVELAFSQNVAGSLHSFRLHRSWRKTPSGTRENLELLRNGEPDDLATEHWSEQVEQFMPARIAQLFLFDGEKIEGYADFEGTSTLIATAIQNLLGLDIVEQLMTDLKTMERRKRSVEAPTPDDVELDGLKSRIEETENERQEAKRACAAQANELDRRRR